MNSGRCLITPMHDQTATLSAFLAAAAAKQPTPGGGAVTALAGALAASMGEMVLQYSVSKKSLAAYAATNTQTLQTLTDIRQRMLMLMAEDQVAFSKLTEARKAGGDTSEWVEACIAVPNDMAVGALLTLQCAEQVADTTNLYLASDLAVCGELAAATVRAAVHNIRANLADVSEERRAYWAERCEHLLERAVSQIQALTVAIREAKESA